MLSRRSQSSWHISTWPWWCRHTTYRATHRWHCQHGGQVNGQWCRVCWTTIYILYRGQIENKLTNKIYL